MSDTTPTPGSEPGDEYDPYSSPAQETTPSSSSVAQPPAWSGPTGDSQPQTRPEPPSSIRRAVTLMYVGAALSLLSVSFLLAGRGKIRDELANKNPDWTRSEVNNAANAVVVVGTIITLLAVAMWLWMAAKNKKGRPWARVVATVLGGFSILFAALSVRTSGSAVTLVFNLVSIALAAVILWFLYRPDSNQYYTATSRAL